MSDDQALYDRATTYQVLSKSLLDKAYWQGYLTGIRRRIAGGKRTNDLEHDTFIGMARSEDQVQRWISSGYKDGLRAKRVLAGEG